MSYALPPAEERVARGAAWLDANVEDWPYRVVLEKLDMSSPCACVLGFVFDLEALHSEVAHTGYDYGLRMAAPFGSEESLRWAQDHGFDWHVGAAADPSADYTQLAAAWTAQIESRRMER